MVLECKIVEFYKGNDPQNTLIVFPYGGGSHLNFREWLTVSCQTRPAAYKVWT